MNNQPKKQHGGARPGSGPKPLPPGEKRKALFPIRLHPSTIAALNKLPEGTRTGFIEAAIRTALDLPPLPGPDYLAVNEEKS